MKIVLRQAVKADIPNIFQWRNSKEVRKASFNSGELNQEEYSTWLASILDDPNNAVLVAEYNSQPVGVLRYEFTQEAEISVFLKQGESGKGFGSAILKAGEAWLKQNHSSLHTLRARILSNNEASINLFQKNGFQLYSCEYKKELK